MKKRKTWNFKNRKTVFWRKKAKSYNKHIDITRRNCNFECADMSGLYVVTDFSFIKSLYLLKLIKQMNEIVLIFIILFKKWKGRDIYLSYMELN